MTQDRHTTILLLRALTLLATASVGWCSYVTSATSRSQLGRALKLAPNDRSLQYIGRHTVNASLGQFDWVATGLEIRIRRGSLHSMPSGASGILSVEMDAGRTRFGVFLGAGRRQQLAEFWTSKGRRPYPIAKAVDVLAAGGVVSVLKLTEHFSQVVNVYSVTLPDGTEPDPTTSTAAAAAAALASKRIDVYGDSDSASFGVLSSRWLPFLCLDGARYEDFSRGWIHGVQMLLGTNSTPVDVRVQAVSGIGVVKNAPSGTETMGRVMKRNLQTVDLDDYSPGSWHPDLIVMYLGSNDWAAFSGPPTKEQFMTAYRHLVDNITAQYQHPTPPPVLHVCGGEQHPCGYIETIANATGSRYTTTFDTGSVKGGCVGHRNAAQQATLANNMAPVIKAAAGW